MSDRSSGLLVSFVGHILRVDSDSSQISSALQTHLHHCLSDNRRTGLITEFSVSSTVEYKFIISENGTEMFAKLDYDMTLKTLMTELISRLVAVCDRGLVLHSAALAWQGNGLLLCGKSSSGKSSLAAWLTAEGFQYLTDEVVEIPLEGENVYGLSRSIFLKSGSAFIWQSRLPDPKAPGFLSFQDGSAWIDPDLFHPGGVVEETKPSMLIFPQYQADVPFRPQKLTTAEVLFRLMQALVNARNLPGHGLDAAARFAQRVKAYSLTYSDIEEARDWIKRTITT